MEENAEIASEKSSKRNIIKDILDLFIKFRFPGFVNQMTTRGVGALALVGLVLGGFIFSPVGGDLPEFCAFQTNFDLPCPGCGLTRSVTSFLQFEFWMSWNYHPFGFMFGIVFILLTPFAFMTTSLRNRIRAKLLPYEHIFGRFFMIYVGVLFLFGIVRIVLITSEVPGFIWWRENKVPAFAEEYVEEQEELPYFLPELYLDVEDR